MNKSVTISFPASDLDLYLPHAQKVLDEVRERSLGKKVLTTTEIKNKTFYIFIEIKE